MSHPDNGNPEHPTPCKAKRELVTALLASYEAVGGINNVDQFNFPSKRAIPTLCEELLRLLFPGFLEEEALVGSELEMITSERVSSVIDRLCPEMTRSLKLRDTTEKNCEGAAHDLCCRFLQRLPEVRALLRTDVEAAYDGDPAARSFEEIILSYPCIEAIAVQRMAHILYQENVPLIPRMMTEWAHDLTGIDIHPGAQIGTHFFIDHGTGVVIGETCEIGDHVKLYQGVTLGARSFPKDANGRVVRGTKRHPTVEDHVTVYANASVLGGETLVGARSIIGGSVFLMHSVPPDTLVTLSERGYRIQTRDEKSSQPAGETAPS